MAYGNKEDPLWLNSTKSIVSVYNTMRSNDIFSENANQNFKLLLVQNLARNIRLHACIVSNFQLYKSIAWHVKHAYNVLRHLRDYIAYMLCIIVLW